MTTIKDIAKVAKVSEATVSRVINNAVNVKPETREKVQAAINRLNYYPNSLARSMRSKKTNSVGLVLADVANPFYAETAKIIIELANKHNYSIILCTTNNDMLDQQKYIDVLLQRKVDGFIFASVHYKDPTLNFVIESKLPYFLYNRRTNESDEHNYVVLDNELGTFLAIEHLYKLGHRRIGLIRGPQSFSTGRERYTGYQKALKHFGLPYDERIVVQGEYSGKKAIEATKVLISTDPPPSAILACSDLMALGALDALYMSGKRIPEDFSVVGFDDIDISSHSAIQLTTVSQNQNLMAEIAFDNLWKVIQNPEQRQPIQVILKPVLAIRKTSDKGPFTP